MRWAGIEALFRPSEILSIFDSNSIRFIHSIAVVLEVHYSSVLSEGHLLHSTNSSALGELAIFLFNVLANVKCEDTAQSRQQRRDLMWTDQNAVAQNLLQSTGCCTRNS